MPQPYRVTNWKEYNQALRRRGSLTLWISEEAIQAWLYTGPKQQGAQYTYSDLAIESCLRLRLVYSLALRQTQGFVESLFSLLEVELPVPDYSTLSHRQASLEVSLCARKKKQKDEEVHVVLDSTGLKVYGPGEWAQRKHAEKRRRTWRKLHLAVDPKTGEITATRLTENKEHDSTQAKPLLEETEENRGSVDRVGGDGAYDKWRCYDAVAAHGATPVILPQKNARIHQHGNAKAPPLPRDEAIRYIRRHGRAKWKQVHGYHLRSLAETAIGRFKGCIGRILRSRTLKNQQAEARLGSQILNRMAALGMPHSVPAMA
ncbi:MAG: IS5 family transposase [Gemmatimonadetes bacterium]|jgi:hypothetical protein|nr:IS5 family transposase [Gemmatimonadota bacterium]